jgi:thymidylate synthase
MKTINKGIEIGLCKIELVFYYNFSLLGDTLYLTSFQRSCDVPLGLNFNQVQVVTL